MIKISKRLQNPELRFYQVVRDSKLPRQQRWNKDNNYPFFHSELDEHLRRQGNYGVCTGFGNLIVLDFDDKDYYKSVKSQLPRTFTVQTAKSKLFHLYYYLDGQMFRKKGIDVDGKRVVDIQAQGAGVVGPGSNINRRYYEVINTAPIATVSTDFLKSVFPFEPDTRERVNREYKAQPEKVQRVVNLFEKIGIERTGDKHWRCPFHDMTGKGNLTIMNNAWIYCFHESKCWKDADYFAEKVRGIKR